MNDFFHFCVDMSLTVQQIAACLNKSKLKTLYIINEHKELVGSVTDGDLRRGIINGVSKDARVAEVMNPNPRYIDVGKSRHDATQLMSELILESIPIVDENKRIVDLIIADYVDTKATIKNPVIIMAGGFGKRLMPLTESLPKPMLQVGNKPILEHIIDRFIMQGFENFNISVYYKAEQITEYFGDGSNKNIKIKYLFEEEPMGTAGCLSLLSTQTDHNLPVILTNGDILTNIDYRALLDFHKSQKADITMCVRKLSINVPFGVVNLDQSRLISLEEKPDIDFTINAGIYVINNNILKKVKPERIDMTEIIENLMVKGKTVCGFPLIENWVDIGHHDELKRAQQFLKD